MIVPVECLVFGYLERVGRFVLWSGSLPEIWIMRPYSRAVFSKMNGG